ncbi:MAG: hypothetical protein IKH57_25595, partial [Clostridia bacterium]|nr:hypothetical protein [Clostridia bacterium]
MLKRKQSMNNADWLDAVSNIRKTVSRDELDKEVETAVEAIRKRAEGKKTAYAWSGGKDSIVLAMLCQKAGVKDCLFVHSDLEYPAFLKWCMEHKPDGCTVINTHQDVDWLALHPEMLFPKSAELVYRWYRLV